MSLLHQILAWLTSSLQPWKPRLPPPLTPGPSIGAAALGRSQIRGVDSTTARADSSTSRSGAEYLHCALPWLAAPIGHPSVLCVALWCVGQDKSTGHWTQHQQTEPSANRAPDVWLQGRHRRAFAGITQPSGRRSRALPTHLRRFFGLGPVSQKDGCRIPHIIDRRPATPASTTSASWTSQPRASVSPALLSAAVCLLRTPSLAAPRFRSFPFPCLLESPDPVVLPCGDILRGATLDQQTRTSHPNPSDVATRPSSSIPHCPAARRPSDRLSAPPHDAASCRTSAADALSLSVCLPASDSGAAPLSSRVCVLRCAPSAGRKQIESWRRLPS
jgi:hypothetical protein